MAFGACLENKIHLAVLRACRRAWPCPIFATTWTAAHQAPLPMEFSGNKTGEGLPFPTRGDLPDPEIEPKSPASPALAGGFLPLVPPGQPSDGKWLNCFKY